MATDDIGAAQEQLGKALERARAGEDKALAALIRDEGLRFVQLFTGLLRMTKVHELTNNAFDKPIEDFSSALKKLWEILGAVHLIAVEDQIYINDIRMRMDFRDQGESLGAILLKHGVGGISFHQVLDIDQIRAMVVAFATPPEEERPRTALKENLYQEGVDTLDVFGVFRFRLAGEETSEVERSATKVMARSSAAVDEAFNNLGNNRMPNPLPLRRAVTEMLQAGVAAEGLWESPSAAGKHGKHSVRVSRFALLLGTAIGLGESALQDLGVASVFHDVGYAAREGATPAKGGQPGHPGYPPPYERHTTAGVRLLLKQRGFHEAKVLRALGVLQHHRDFDDPNGKPSLFARILRIVEDYDNLSCSKKARYCPALALALMTPKAGSYYDPVLLQAFVNIMGKYPPGTLLELADGRWVRSRSVVRQPELFAKPLAYVVREANGSRPSVQAILDLAFEGEVRGVVTE